MTQMKGGEMVPAEAQGPKTYAIIGAAMEVHRVLGCGFVEYVYQQALAVELKRREVPFAREVELCVYYKDVVLDCRYKADFICYGEIVVETKAIKQLTNVDRSQVVNQLRAVRLHRGLLFNFATKSLEYERVTLFSNS